MKLNYPFSTLTMIKFRLNMHFVQQVVVIWSVTALNLLHRNHHPCWQKTETIDFHKTLVAAYRRQKPGLHCWRWDHLHQTHAYNRSSGLARPCQTLGKTYNLHFRVQPLTFRARNALSWRGGKSCSCNWGFLEHDAATLGDNWKRKCFTAAAASVEAWIHASQQNLHGWQNFQWRRPIFCLFLYERRSLGSKRDSTTRKWKTNPHTYSVPRSAGVASLHRVWDVFCVGRVIYPPTPI